MTGTLAGTMDHPAGAGRRAPAGYPPSGMDS
jgi:hypothetical protein